MIKSVNIFKSNHHSEFPIRIEFWQDDKLIEVIETHTMTPFAEKIREFIVTE